MMNQNLKNNQYNVEPLNGDNYESWKFRVETILTEHGISEMIRNQHRDEDYADAKLREEAKAKDNKGKSIIVQCVKDTQIDINV